MRSDIVTETCINDKTIIKLGTTLYEKKYGNIQKELIRQNMRQIARLLLTLNETDSAKKTLADWLHLNYFDSFVVVVKIVTSFKENLSTRSEFKVPSLALKLGHNIRKFINIEKGIALRTNNYQRMKELKKFNFSHGFGIAF